MESSPVAAVAEGHHGEGVVGSFEFVARFNDLQGILVVVDRPAELEHLALFGVLVHHADEFFRTWRGVDIVDGGDHADTACAGLLEEVGTDALVDGEFQVHCVHAGGDAFLENFVSLPLITGVVPAFIARANGEDDRQGNAFLEALNGSVNIDRGHVANWPFGFRGHDVLDFAVFVFNRLCFGSLEVEAIESHFDVVGTCEVGASRFIRHFFHGRAFKGYAHFWVSHGGTHLTSLLNAHADLCTAFFHVVGLTRIDVR